MNWFEPTENLTADYFVDLGTANTLFSSKDKGVIIEEPSTIAFTLGPKGKKQIVAVGKEAHRQFEASPGNIQILKPLKEGVIADFDTTEIMLRFFLQQFKLKTFWSKPKLVICLPFGVTEVEKKAVIDAGKAAGAKDVYLVDEPLVAAIGAGLAVKEAKGSMIIDIGGGTTEIAVIALADIVYCQTARIGGNRFDQDIIDYLKKKKNLLIQDEQAEQLKIELGTACPKINIVSKTIQGREAQSNLVKKIEVTSEDIGLAIDDSLKAIIFSIHQAIENTPPELLSDIIDRGLTVTGGGALLKDLDLRLQNEVQLKINIAKDPLRNMARGGEVLLNDAELLGKIRVEV